MVPADCFDFFGNGCGTLLRASRTAFVGGGGAKSVVAQTKFTVDTMRLVRFSREKRGFLEF